MDWHALLGRDTAPPARGMPQQESPMMEVIRRLLGGGGRPNSSPSVFDSRRAMDEHNQRLQRALEGRE